MTKKDISEVGLLPHVFKYVGYVLSGACIIYALIHHLFGANFLFGTLHTPHMLFVCGLIIAISSKEVVDDERIRQLRSYASTVIVGLLIGFILFEELKKNPGSLLIELSASLTIYLLVYHITYYFNTDWIVSNKVKAWLALVVVGICILLIYDYLWLA